MVLTKLRIKRGTTDAWNQPPPASGPDPTLLEEGEIGYDYVANIIKIGHSSIGAKRWSEIPASNIGLGSSLPTLNLCERQIFFNTSDNSLNIYHAGSWRTIAGGGSGSLPNGSATGDIYYYNAQSSQWVLLHPPTGDGNHYLSNTKNGVVAWDNSPDITIDQALNNASNNPLSNSVITGNIKFGTSEPLVNRDVGGLASGTDISGLTVKEVINLIFYGNTLPVTQPYATSYSPEEGFNNGSTTLIISGGNLDDIDGVKLIKAGQDDIVATNVNSGANSVSCDVDLSGTQFANDWSIRMSAGSDTYTVGYFPIKTTSPIISTLSQSSANMGATLTDLSINGNYFLDGATVYLARSGFNSLNCTNVRVTSNLNILCDVDIPHNYNYVGVWTVRVMNPDGNVSTSNTSFNVTTPDYPSPIVISATPDQIEEGTSNCVVTVTGSNFQSGCRVKIGESISAKSVSFSDSSLLQATFDIPLAAIGQFGITVINPDNKSSNSDILMTLTGHNPVVTSISPSAGNIGMPMTYTVSGSPTGYYANGAKVILKKSGSSDIELTTTWISASSIKFTTSLSGVTEGNWIVRVKNPDQQLNSELSVTLTVNPPYPHIDTISPSSSVRNAAGNTTAFTINGSYFQNGATVSLGNGIDLIAATGVNVSSSQILCNIDLSGRSIGIWTLKVTNPDSHYDTITFKIEPFVPGITSLDPFTLYTDNLYTFTVTGTNFEISSGYVSYLEITNGTTTIPIYQYISVTSTQIQFRLQGTGVVAGNYNVFIKNPNPAGATKTSPTSLVLTVSAPPQSGNGLYWGMKEWDTTLDNISSFSGLTFEDGWTPTASKRVIFTPTGASDWKPVFAYLNSHPACSKIEYDGGFAATWNNVVKTIDGKEYRIYMFPEYITDSTPVTFFWSV